MTVDLPEYVSVRVLKGWCAINRELRVDASRSNRAIASACGCSHHTVARIRALFDADPEALNQELQDREDPMGAIDRFFEAVEDRPLARRVEEILERRATTDYPDGQSRRPARDAGGER